jgi:hypothetical protein
MPSSEQIVVDERSDIHVLPARTQQIVLSEWAAVQRQQVQHRSEVGVFDFCHHTVAELQNSD